MTKALLSAVLDDQRPWCGKPGWPSADDMLTKDETGRIAANIANAEAFETAGITEACSSPLALISSLDGNE